MKNTIWVKVLENGFFKTSFQIAKTRKTSFVKKLEKEYPENRGFKIIIEN